MELRDIEIFLTLAEELHFGRTAERLHLTTARVSQSIKKQERVIGGPLFDRTSRAVSLTSLGKLLRDDLLPAHRQIQRAVDRAAAEARGITGTVRVGYTTPWCADLALQAGRAFSDRYAGCTVLVQEVQFKDMLGPLRRGELDLQLSELPARSPGIADGPVLFREPRALMVPAGHLLARRDSVSLEDLAGVPLIRSDGGLPESLIDLHIPVRTPMGLPIPDGPAYTFWPEIPALVAAGLGASIVAARAARYHARPGIAFVPFRDGPTLDYGVLRLASGQTPPAAAFVELLADLAS
ncbi:DNA-binding transcriptional LysR family regulator [Allocatelliglobosispora scoriae]|uniref:DNA-binding transcriptional LysR family regulator n=1 Tax=Allocatelliglobosispora scoriae TaxID=643052 RepID=A0A841BGU3_9ACTN|nr:LysR family transcriptional regulator [Allocatelliglobosispora scoriae]MBB5866855.1 DNA-binding transcriptional LysR family regulator [Allocatelliglobosispora scoriae]